VSDLLSNPALVYGIVAWCLAQGIKILIDWRRDGELDWSLVTAAGGMPSSHSALVCAMAVAIAFREGLDSPLFALAVGVAGVVMYDATSIRRAAGQQATVLNQIIEELFQGHPISEEKLKELLGHTPTQVLFGALLGTILTLIGMRLVWDGA
jgi:acid phosphatase family membrane protein YuiD